MEAKILETAFLIRHAEEALLKLFEQGLLHGTIHTCLGQELTGACLAPLLKSSDTVFSTHRGHGHYLSVTSDLSGFLGELLGKSTGCAGGVGGSQHLHRGNYFSNGIQGGILPLAAGTAWAHQLDRTKNAAVAIVGDGTLGEGAFYETINIAVSWKLPLLLVLEDNQYAQSTKTSSVLTGKIPARLRGCGLNVLEADTWNAAKLSKTYGRALKLVRAGKGPVAVVVNTYRLAPHSTRDDFRSKKELEAHAKKDFLNTLLRKKDKAALKASEKMKALLDRELAKALAAPAAARSEKEEGLTREWTEIKSRAQSKAPYRQLLNKAFATQFAKNKNALLLGEDLEDPYGGCFKVTEGLSTKFPGRVRNTPISEAAIAGIATGAALMGKQSYAELMFGDFTLLAMDQIVNHAAKFAEMYPARKPAVCFRAPMGAGRGYGPTHSQSLEKHFLGVPGLDVFSLNAFVDPEAFFRQAPFSGPRLLAEHKLLYREPLITEFPAPWKVWREKNSFDHWITPGGTEPLAILVAHGAQASVLWAAAQRLLLEHELPVALFLSTKLSGYEAKADVRIWLKGTPLVAFEEGQGYASFSAELAAQLNENLLVRPFSRWAPPARATPSSPGLEAEFRLTPEKVIAEVLEIQW